MTTLVATDQLAAAVDAAQYQTGQGPCLDTLYDQATVRVADTAAETRWPQFTRRAARLGVGGMLSIQLYADGGTWGR